MNSLGILLTSICVVMVMVLPRRWAMLGVFGAVCYITQGQILNIGGNHLHAIRLVEMAGFVRILVRGELLKLKFNGIDRCIVLWAVFSEAVEAYRLGVFVEQAADTLDILLPYFVFRCLITNWEEIEELLPKLALFVVPLAVCMLLEMRTGHSIFMALNGLYADNDREGRFRCTGAFRAPQTAGTFGATLIPLFIGLYWINPQRRRAAITGIIAATAITYTSNSGGPMMAYLSGLFALMFWRWRTEMKKVRWGIVIALIGLDIVMKAPIWYLLAKISNISGGDGWYRAYLMEQCFRHFSDWWLMGTSDTSHWAVTLLRTGGADLCNMYVACAAASGLGSLILFVVLLSRGFQYLGRALRVAREISSPGEKIFWCMGCVLFAHVVTLFSVTYWDQFQAVWWGFLALIASAASAILTEPAPAEAVEETGDSRPIEAHA